MTEESLRKELGQRIRQWRRWKNLTQKELAEIVGAESPSYICEIEKGRKSPSIYGLYRIEKALRKNIWLEGDSHQRSDK